MTRTRLLMAGILAAVGIVWTLQGLGILEGRSFMVGDPTWIVIGLATIVVAGLYAAWPRLRQR